MAVFITLTRDVTSQNMIFLYYFYRLHCIDINSGAETRIYLKRNYDKEKNQW